METLGPGMYPDQIGLNSYKRPEDEWKAEVLYNILANHGIAVHYSMLGEIARHNGLNVGDRSILNILKKYPDVFESQGEGIWFLAGKSEGSRYPEKHWGQSI